MFDGIFGRTADDERDSEQGRSTFIPARRVERSSAPAGTVAPPAIEPWRAQLDSMLNDAYAACLAGKPSPVTYGHAVGFLDALHLVRKIDRAELALNQSHFKALLVDGTLPRI